jgi:hypothetical protein
MFICFRLFGQQTFSLGFVSTYLNLLKQSFKEVYTINLYSICEFSPAFQRLHVCVMSQINAICAYELTVQNHRIMNFAKPILTCKFEPQL